MSGDDHFIKPDNNAPLETEGLSPDLKDIVRRLLAGPLSGDALFEEAAGVIIRLHFDLRFIRGCNEVDRRNLRHWRDECGKLHGQIAKLKDDLRAWEIAAKRVEEAESSKTFDDGSCIRCGAAPRNASGLCATCVDEDAVRAGEIDLSPCEYCTGGKRTGLPGNACENCLGTGLKYPEHSK